MLTKKTYVYTESIVGGAGHHQTELIENYGAVKLSQFLKVSNLPASLWLRPLTDVLPLQIAIPVQIFWGISLSLCKLSILILYASIFEVRAFVLMAKATGAVIILWMAAITLSSVLICRPFPYTWGEGTGTCGNQVTSYLVTGVLNIVTDLIVLLLPLPYFIRLEMALFKKVVLICTFTAGIL